MSQIKYILTDIDDTLTWQSNLPASVLQALLALQQAGYHIIPVTGGCAGWSDLIARLWPVSGVITEGGACFLHKDQQGRLQYDYWGDEQQMQANKRILLDQVNAVLSDFPKLRLAQDQAYRLTDVAVDYAQDIIPSEPQQRDALLSRLQSMGVQAKASSIHVNIWQGDYDKYAMAQRVLTQHFGLSLQQMRQQVLFIGDAPNDESMFEHFPISVGVANIQQHLSQMHYQPSYITQAFGGYGFAELAEQLLRHKTPSA